MAISQYLPPSLMGVSKWMAVAKKIGAPPPDSISHQGGQADSLNHESEELARLKLLQSGMKART